MNFNINELQILLNASKSEDEEQYKIACDQYIQFASIFIQLRNQLQNNNELNQQQKQDLHFQITQILSFSISRAELLEKRIKSSSITINSNNINNLNLSKPIALHYLFHFCDRTAELLILLNRNNDATRYYAQAAEYGLELISKYKVPFQSEVKNVLSKAETLKLNTSTTTSPTLRQSPVNSLQQQFNNLNLFTNSLSSSSLSSPNSSSTPTAPLVSSNISNRSSPNTFNQSSLPSNQRSNSLSPINTNINSINSTSSSSILNNNNMNNRKSLSPTTMLPPSSSSSNNNNNQYSPTSPKYNRMSNLSSNSSSSIIDVDNFNFSSLIIPSTPLTPINSNNSNNANSNSNNSTTYSLNTSSPFERSLISTTVNGAVINQQQLNNQNILNNSNNNTNSNIGNKIKPITDEEIQVLKYTSVMQSGLLLYPWNDELDLNENFTFSQPFIDQQFNNVLSKEQLSKLYKWLRPHEIIEMKLNNQQNITNPNLSPTLTSPIPNTSSSSSRSSPSLSPIPTTTATSPIPTTSTTTTTNNITNHSSSNQSNQLNQLKYPQLIYQDEINEENIVQSHVVTDCSFVASLCVAALYERKYKKKLITNSIYPQDPITGRPYYNPHGKYSIKIYFNGVARKVIIDDRLPVDINGNLLCSYSTNMEEFWISLMEKAYMKVNGGYNFPGSNSGIDLYALTGWIPEEVKIITKLNNSSSPINTINNNNIFNQPSNQLNGNNGHNNIQMFDKELLWKRMHDGFQLGKCLITISTGHLDKQTEELVGLYANHAYAILDVREIKFNNTLNMNINNNLNLNNSNQFNQLNNLNNFNQLNNNNINNNSNNNSNNITRLIKVKNPWTKKGWKGPYSSYDKQIWTDKLKKELEYDASIKNQEDDGIFWMNYESLLKYFQTVHFSWNPDLFPYTEIKHECWDNRIKSLDGTDHYTMNGNPQFRLKLHGKGSVWIMLTKHYTSLEERDRDYLTFHIHRGSSSSIGDTTVFKQGMDRVFYNENTLIHKGRYSNDPHYRICLNSNDLKHSNHHSNHSNHSNGNNSNNSGNGNNGNNDNELSIFRIVLSQHGMIQTIRYSLFCYSTVPCTLESIPFTYKYFRSVRDSWTLNSCGGSCNQINTYRLNPQYLISLPNNSNNLNGGNRCISPHTLFDKTNLRFSLSCLQPLDINIMVFCNQGQPIHLPAKELMITSTGNYRRCFAMCKLSSQELTYFQKDFTTNPIFPLTVVLSNFSGSLGDFEFRVESTHTLIELKKIV